MVPETPLEKAQVLVNKVLKDANSCRNLGGIIKLVLSRKGHLLYLTLTHCWKQVWHSFQLRSSFLICLCLRDHAFKLRPLSMSSDLIKQLQACAVKLGNCAEQLQQKIRAKCNRNRDYKEIIAEADQKVSLLKLVIIESDRYPFCFELWKWHMMSSLWKHITTPQLPFSGGGHRQCFQGEGGSG